MCVFDARRRLSRYSALGSLFPPPPPPGGSQERSKNSGEFDPGRGVIPEPEAPIPTLSVSESRTGLELGL